MLWFNIVFIQVSYWKTKIIIVPFYIAIVQSKFFELIGIQVFSSCAVVALSHRNTAKKCVWRPQGLQLQAHMHIIIVAAGLVPAKTCK
ncbi:MAG: hypothetical protein ABIJ30_05995, partial [bacterium]